MSHEALRQKIPELHFKPEGYLSEDSQEYLEQFLRFISSNGFEPDKLLFHGFDGTKAAKGKPTPSLNAIFAMNEVGWRKSLGKEENPAGYAKGMEVPCIGLFDRSQLANVYSHDLSVNADLVEDTNDLGELKIGEHFFEISSDNSILDERIRIENIVIDQPMSELPIETPIFEVVVHRDYPNASPIDALVGLVYLDRE